MISFAQQEIVGVAPHAPTVALFLSSLFTQ